MDERKLSSTMQSAELTPFQKLKINKIEDSIEESSKALANHKIYNAIETIEDLQIFMSHHIYCVWDFMNLIKVGFEFNQKSLFNKRSDQNKLVQNLVWYVDLIPGILGFLTMWIWSDLFYKLTFNFWNFRFWRVNPKKLT